MLALVYRHLIEGVDRGVLEDATNFEDTLVALMLGTAEHAAEVQLIYRGRLRSPEVAVGEESQEVALVRWDDIPWDDLAFPTNHWSLRQHRTVEELDSFPPFTTPPRR